MILLNWIIFLTFVLISYFLAAFSFLVIITFGTHRNVYSDYRDLEQSTVFPLISLPIILSPIILTISSYIFDRFGIKSLVFLSGLLIYHCFFYFGNKTSLFEHFCFISSSRLVQKILPVSSLFSDLERSTANIKNF